MIFDKKHSNVVVSKKFLKEFLKEGEFFVWGDKEGAKWWGAKTKKGISYFMGHNNKPPVKTYYLPYKMICKLRDIL